MAKKIKIDMEYYTNLIDTREKYYEKSIDLHYKNKELIRENEVLKDALNKEQDTQLIKYQGKIYRITSTTHYSDIGEADTLQICATDRGEVNMDGKSEM
jgi:hypothetical protein